MTQNIYDDDAFRAGYRGLPRSQRGLAGAPEWPALRAMLPPLAGRRVVDLGCGFGWFCRWAADAGASSVLGLDVSARMLEQAVATTDAATVEYRRADLETIELEPQSVDLAYSSLALHYVADLTRLFRTVRGALVDGGRLVFSVEHPIFSAPTDPRFVDRGDGRSEWPVDRYLEEGPRTRTWFVDGVVKHHRTIATHVNALLDAGFGVERLVEWGPTDAQIATDAALARERDRPAFLLVGAVTSGAGPAH